MDATYAVIKEGGLDPNDVVARNIRAEALVLMERFQGALDLTEEIVGEDGLDPGNINAHIIRAGIFSHLGQDRKALEEISRIHDMNGADHHYVRLEVLRANVLVKMGVNREDVLPDLFEVVTSQTNLSERSLMYLVSGLVDLGIPKSLIEELENHIHYRSLIGKESFRANLPYILSRIVDVFSGMWDVDE